MLPDQLAAIVSIGDELMLGQRFDTNAPWLSEQLLGRGIHTLERVVLHDDLESIRDALLRLAGRVGVILLTGGLGPTDDDLTRAALAAALGEELVLDETALAELEHFFRKRGRVLIEKNRIQAMRPASGRLLANPHGTAPGIAAAIGAGGRETAVFALPGPPREMHPMFDAHVAPTLPAAPVVIATRVIHTLGIGESDLAARLGELMQRDRNPLVGTTASGGSVSCRIRFEGEAGTASATLNATCNAIESRAGSFIVGVDSDEVQHSVVRTLAERSEWIVTAESCTGGMLGAMITMVDGASSVYLGGWQTYANVMKERELAVPHEMLEEYGAVSREVAEAMARGALAGAAWPEGAAGMHALAITGVAGPGGGSDTKPVGTVFIARASVREHETECVVKRFQFRGGRDDVRSVSAKMALAMLWRQLRGIPDEPLLWERPNH